MRYTKDDPGICSVPWQLAAATESFFQFDEWKQTSLTRAGEQPASTDCNSVRNQPTAETALANCNYRSNRYPLPKPDEAKSEWRVRITNVGAQACVITVVDLPAFATQSSAARAKLESSVTLATPLLYRAGCPQVMKLRKIPASLNITYISFTCACSSAASREFVCQEVGGGAITTSANARCGGPALK